MSSFEEIFRENGMALTSSRIAIFNVLENSRTHLTVNDIYNLAKKEEPNIGVATVYRTLNTLCELSLVEKHEFPNNLIVYEKSDRTNHHHHIIDVNDNSIIEFSSDKLDGLLEEVAKKYGYKILGHKIEIYGEKKK